jgi:predicted DsbA family dithiol-disulfide isomerase
MPAASKAMKSTASKSIRVEVVSDVVCPWCYIGESRLQKAIFEAEAKFGKTISVSHIPFILRPDFPKKGVDKLRMFTEMFGSKIQAKRKLEEMQRAALADGLPFVLGQKAGNSVDAHRLLDWARTQGKEEMLLEEIYRMYNCEAKWVGDRHVLVDAAGRAGLDMHAAKKFLANENARLDEVMAGLENARELDVQSVPVYFVNGRRLPPGAPSSQGFVSLFEQEE